MRVLITILVISFAGCVSTSMLGVLPDYDLRGGGTVLIQVHDPQAPQNTLWIYYERGRFQWAISRLIELDLHSIPSTGALGAKQVCLIEREGDRAAVPYSCVLADRDVQEATERHMAYYNRIIETEIKRFLAEKRKRKSDP